MAIFDTSFLAFFVTLDNIVVTFFLFFFLLEKFLIYKASLYHITPNTERQNHVIYSGDLTEITAKSQVSHTVKLFKKSSKKNQSAVKIEPTTYTLMSFL
jgi:hypothetical protein